jgi:hypothetical protein
VQDTVATESLWYADSLQLLGVPPAVHVQLSWSTGVVYQPLAHGWVPCAVVHIGVIVSAHAADAVIIDTATATSATSNTRRLMSAPAA